ncbi:MAG: hypothetical protein JO152_15255 [Mycobacteriaceae bacterium]|nr:hypothetical protein [Mycobacteriaceae bacterium]
MRQLKRLLTSAAVSALAMGSVSAVGSSAVAAADGNATAGESGAKIVPFSTLFRRCDHTDVTNVEGGGDGQGFAAISRDGSTVRADVTFQAATPDTTYGVRLIEMPRSPVDSCDRGGPGTVVTYPTTDGGGNFYVTLQEDVAPGATGAWVFIDGPHSGSKPYGEYYTSDFVAAI